MKKELLEQLLSEMTATGAEFGEVFYENTVIKDYQYIDGKFENIRSNYRRGVGLRATRGTMPVYVSSSCLEEGHLLSLAKEVASKFSGKRDREVTPLGERVVKEPVVEIPHRDFPVAERKKMMQEVDRKVRALSDLISQVDLRFHEEDQEVIIANTDGVWVQTTRPATRFFLIVTSSRDGKSEQSYTFKGIAGGMELLSSLDLDAMIEECVTVAVQKLDAQDFKGGTYPVVLGNGFGGVIIHEACVHGLEATSVSIGKSVFKNDLHKQVANEIVTVIDDATCYPAWGSLFVDDEGESGRKNVLIEHGVLKSFLVDRFHSGIMHHPLTGSARRESYHYMPTSRMTNTYLAPGKDTVEEMIASIDYGVYCKAMGGGSVITATGDFNFNVVEAYLIEQGKVTTPLRNVSLIGNSKEVLQNIEMVGSDFELADGYCGSTSGNVLVTIGQPTIKVAKMLIGGK